VNSCIDVLDAILCAEALSCPAFQHSEYTTVGELQKHLERGPKDPQIRHGYVPSSGFFFFFSFVPQVLPVPRRLESWSKSARVTPRYSRFLKSDDSRSPLNCSPEIFKTLSTHQQIDSSFLEAVYAFGDQEDPKDLCLMNFSSGHTLTAPQDKLVAIPELDRSGREIRVSYLLRSVEKKKNKEWPWQIRQAAVYHSFDTESGKSFWFTIKGNSQLSSRIMQVSSADLDLPSSQPPRAREDPIPYFRASLATHLIYISWCDENWRNCINDLENGIRKLLDSARKAPIDDDLPSDNPSKLVTYPRSLRQSRSNTMQSRNNTGLSRPEAGIRKQSTWGILNGASLSLMGTNNALPNAANADLEMAAQQPPIGALQGIDLNNGSNEALIDKREVLNRFRFGDIQTLHTYGDRIQRSILTLKLNISVLRDLGSFYQNLFALDIATFRNIKDACKDDLADFLDEVKSITRSLETRQTQLECLATLLTEGITLVSFPTRCVSLSYPSRHRLT